MCLGPLKYFKGLRHIQSHVHTHTQSIAFFECISVLRSTAKVSNTFKVTYTHTQSIAFFECIWVLRSTLKVSDTFKVMYTHTHNPLLSSNPFQSFKVLRKYQMYSKSLTHTIHCFLRMCFSPSKYFEGIKCIRSPLHTYNPLLSSNTF